MLRPEWRGPTFSAARGDPYTALLTADSVSVLQTLPIWTCLSLLTGAPARPGHLPLVCQNPTQMFPPCSAVSGSLGTPGRLPQSLPAPCSGSDTHLPVLGFLVHLSLR